MDTKLTLKLEQDIIEKAKYYASLHNTSLSRIIEGYLQELTNNNEEKDQITPLVKSLSGIIDVSQSFDHKKGYSDFLVKKYT